MQILIAKDKSLEILCKIKHIYTEQNCVLFSFFYLRTIFNKLANGCTVGEVNQTRVRRELIY